jgi:hypothetical protein
VLQQYLPCACRFIHDVRNTNSHVRRSTTLAPKTPHAGSQRDNDRQHIARRASSGSPHHERGTPELPDSPSLPSNEHSPSSALVQRGRGSTTLLLAFGRTRFAHRCTVSETSTYFPPFGWSLVGHPRHIVPTLVRRSGCDLSASLMTSGKSDAGCKYCSPGWSGAITGDTATGCGCIRLCSASLAVITQNERECREWDVHEHLRGELFFLK